MSQIDLLLNYSERFYEWQFHTRKAINHDLLNNMGSLLNDYLADGTALKSGPPTVEYLAEEPKPLT